MPSFRSFSLSFAACLPCLVALLPNLLRFSMLLYRTQHGVILEHEGKHVAPRDDFESLVNRDDLAAYLLTALREKPALAPPPPPQNLLPPIGDRQELWAAGVTYLRSMTARKEESKEAGGSNFYDKVYHADRPELFFKATPHRCVGTGSAMHLRRDSKWMVPEPELTLVITRTGKVIGYTAGNDLSCRDIEGENPLYLPQAKTFHRCAALGPAILVSDTLPSPDTGIAITIDRAGSRVFQGSTKLSQMKKKLPDLAQYLFRDNQFPHGCLLMTGTGIVPPNDFTLALGDVVSITIDGVGTLVNTMA